MPMPVVEVGRVGMCVNKRLVGVWMTVARLDQQARMGMIVVAVVVPMAMRIVRSVTAGGGSAWCFEWASCRGRDPTWHTAVPLLPSPLD